MTNVPALLLKINPGIVFGGGGGGVWERSGDCSILWSVFPCPDSLPLLAAFCSARGHEGPPEIPGTKVSATAGVHTVGKDTTFHVGFCLRSP